MIELEVLAARFRVFAGAATSRAPLYRRLAVAIADDPEVLRLMAAAPTEQAMPVLLLASAHELLLQGIEHPLRSFYPNLTDTPSTGDPYPAFRSFVLAHADAIRIGVATNHTQTNEVGRCALFVPALGLLADEAGPLSLVDVGTSAGLNLLLTEYAYDYEPGGPVGSASTVHIRCGTRGAPPIPADIPAVAAACGLDPKPIDVTDERGARWLEACVWPDHTERFHRLVAAIGLARNRHLDVRVGDAVHDVASTVRRAATHGHPVVLNSWVLSYLSEAERGAYVAELDALGSSTDLSWVLAESPAHTPGLPVPTTEPPEEATVLSLARWRNGTRTLTRLATCHPHGAWIHWEPAPA